MPVNKTEAVSEALIHVSDKLGYTSQKVFEIYTQAQQAQAAANIASLLTAGVLIGASLFLAGRKIKSLSLRGEDKHFAYLVAAMVSLFASLIVADVVHTTVLQLVAPEYMAVQEIMSQLGEVIG